MGDPSKICLSFFGSRAFAMGCVVLGLWAGSLEAGAVEAGATLQAPLQLTRRTGRTACWAEWDVAFNAAQLDAAPSSVGPGGSASLCVPIELWRQTLKHGTLPARWKGRWSESSAPLNPPKNAKSGPKLIHLTFDAREADWTPAPTGISITRLGIGFGPSGLPSHVFNWWIVLTESIREQVATELAEVDDLGLLRSLWVGQAKPGETSQWLRELGLIHLFSESGLYFYYLLRWTSLACFLLIQKLPQARRISDGIALLLCWMLWILSGATAGIFRALLILGSRTLLRDQGVRISTFWPLVVTVAMTPWAGFYSGLSIWGVVAALQATQKPRSSPSRAQVLREHAIIALGSWVPIAFVQVFRDGHIAPYTPLLNFVTAPIIAGLVFPASGFAMITHQHRFLDALNRVLCRVFEKIIALLLNHGGWLGVSSGALVASLVAGLIAWMLASASQRWIGVSRAVRLLQWALTLVIASALWSLFEIGHRLPHSTAKELRATQILQLDVGQGDSAWVSWEDGASSLIDTGSVHALAMITWLNIFNSLKVEKIQSIALTHLDEDHRGGLLELARIIPINCVASAPMQWKADRGIQLRATLQAWGIRVTDWAGQCYPGRVLSPQDHPRLKHGKLPDNAAMSGFEVPLTEGGCWIGLGDATAEQELQLIHQLTVCDHVHPLALKLSHHGSKTSTSQGLLKSLEPDWAWISLGVGNHFGHPSPETLALLRPFEAAGMEVHRTDREGALVFRGAAVPRRPLKYRP